MKAGDGDRTTCMNATKAELRPARKPLKLAAANHDVRHAGKAVSVVQDGQTAGYRRGVMGLDCPDFSF